VDGVVAGLAHQVLDAVQSLLRDTEDIVGLVLHAERQLHPVRLGDRFFHQLTAAGRIPYNRYSGSPAITLKRQ